mmetsp:Transcript_22486/g.62750  ORF Transcript_22486/g.62750 Transcript_22486/m.62750 type:complete len:222 (-) Transcript_22486:733-1398(-)
MSIIPTSPYEWGVVFRQLLRIGYLCKHAAQSACLTPDILSDVIRSLVACPLAWIHSCMQLNALCFILLLGVAFCKVVVFAAIYRSPSVAPPMLLAIESAGASMDAPAPGPDSSVGADGTRTTLRKSISHSVCIMATNSWRDMRLMAGSTFCISAGACPMNCCHVPTMFCRLKYIGRRVTGSPPSPSSAAFCILIWAIVKTGISLKVALNFGESVMAFSMAA